MCPKFLFLFHQLSIVIAIAMVALKLCGHSSSLKWVMTHVLCLKSSWDHRTNKVTRKRIIKIRTTIQEWVWPYQDWRLSKKVYSNIQRGIQPFANQKKEKKRGILSIEIIMRWILKKIILPEENILMQATGGCRKGNSIFTTLQGIIFLNFNSISTTPRRIIPLHFMQRPLTKGTDLFFCIP